jgi:hypothetical protein
MRLLRKWSSTLTTCRWEIRDGLTTIVLPRNPPPNSHRQVVRVKFSFLKKHHLSGSKIPTQVSLALKFCFKLPEIRLTQVKKGEWWKTQYRGSNFLFNNFVLILLCVTSACFVIQFFPPLTCAISVQTWASLLKIFARNLRIENSFEKYLQ